MTRAHARLKYLPILLTVLLSGCSLLSNDVATLWTNRPEFAAYVELFNTSQKKYRIEIVYRASPAQSIATSNTVPDLVVADRLASVNISGNFTPLDQLLGKGGINTADFYQNLLATGKRDGRQVLLPVSFDLPVILYQHDASPSTGKDTLLSLDALQKSSQEFNKKATHSFDVMGFSPLWSPNFLFSTAELLGAGFHQTARGNLAWDEESLQKSIAKMRTWVKELDGGPKEESTFREKYLYDPVYKLLASGRILYHYSTITKYFDIPQEKRKSIQFRWLAEGTHVPVVEDIIYAGVPARSRHKRAADAFLTWFFNPETQSQLLEASRYERLKTFGIADGFSALSVVNERDFPQYYPILLGKIPPPDYLAYPKSLPSDWADLKSNVIIPWMQQEVLSPGPDQKLETRLKAWRLQKPLP